MCVRTTTGLMWLQSSGNIPHTSSNSQPWSSSNTPTHCCESRLIIWGFTTMGWSIWGFTTMGCLMLNQGWSSSNLTSANIHQLSQWTSSSHCPILAFSGELVMKNWLSPRQPCLTKVHPLLSYQQIIWLSLLAHLKLHKTIMKSPFFPLLSYPHPIIWLLHNY